MEAVRDQLRKSGPATVISFAPLYWKYATIFLPYFGLDLPSKALASAGELRKVTALWHDDVSRQVYLSELTWRLQGDTVALSASSQVSDYVVNGVRDWSKDEVFVDCGAYDGDTIRSILGRAVDFKRIVALEPDPGNFAKLGSYVESLDHETGKRFTLLKTAAGATTGKLRFSGEGTEQAMITEEGSIEVDCGILDELAAPYEPTYIKMDIEGAEEDALNGMRRLVTAFEPVIAVSIYHRPDDLWRLPLLMQKITPPGYRFALRRHAQAGWDLVAYAYPER